MTIIVIFAMFYTCSLLVFPFLHGIISWIHFQSRIIQQERWGSLGAVLGH